MNFAMWKKALTVIPNVTKEEWDKLDIISKWLISTRAAVLLMTFLSAVLAGLFAWHDGYKVNLLSWFILALGLVLAHASNNIFNDYTDYTRGVDKDNYYRTHVRTAAGGGWFDDQAPASDLFRGDRFPGPAVRAVPDLYATAMIRPSGFCLGWGFLCPVLYLAAEIHCHG